MANRTVGGNNEERFGGNNEILLCSNYKRIESKSHSEWRKFLENVGGKSIYSIFEMCENSFTFFCIFERIKKKSMNP